MSKNSTFSLFSGLHGELKSLKGQHSTRSLPHTFQKCNKNNGFLKIMWHHDRFSSTRDQYSSWFFHHEHECVQNHAILKVYWHQDGFNHMGDQYPSWYFHHGEANVDKIMHFWRLHGITTDSTSSRTRFQHVIYIRMIQMK